MALVQNCFGQKIPRPYRRARREGGRAEGRERDGGGGRGEGGRGGKARGEGGGEGGAIKNQRLLDVYICQ